MWEAKVFAAAAMATAWDAVVEAETNWKHKVTADRDNPMSGAVACKVNCKIELRLYHTKYICFTTCIQRPLGCQ